MNMMTRFAAVGFVAAATLATAPAQATKIPNGTLSSVGLFNPTVNLAANPKTFTATTGATFETVGTGGFTSAGGQFGVLNGSLNFSNVAGTTLLDNVANFFTFSNGADTFSFSVAKVKTISFANDPGVSSSFTLYLLGTTVDSLLGYEATDTSLTLQFSNTGTSAYSALATLAVPPARVPGVPEPATWAMALMGFGAMGVAMRRRPRTSVSFA
jgi:hypothetical protein